MVVWFVGWAAGMRVYPQRLQDGRLDVRLGALYRAGVPLESVVRVARRREDVDRGYRGVVRDGKGYLVANGRVDVHLELAAPVELVRPLAGPTSVRSLAFAADDPVGLVRELERRRSAAS